MVSRLSETSLHLLLAAPDFVSSRPRCKVQGSFSDLEERSALAKCEKQDADFLQPLNGRETSSMVISGVTIIPVNLRSSML